MGNFFKASAGLRPSLNIGCLMDIPTGSYRKGKNGEHILNGGLSHLTGIGGMGNTFKSTIGHYMILRALSRYAHAQGSVYDTELSLNIDRLRVLADWMDDIGDGALEDCERFLLTDKTMQTGNEWFEAFKAFISEKKNNPKQNTGQTPFLDKEGKPISAFAPSLFEIDSLSQMETAAVMEKLDKNEIGSKDLNMEAMDGARAKTQLFNQLPGLTASSGTYLVATAHIGQEHQLDPYAPPKKKLAFLKGNLKFKNVPEKFTFLTNNCWYALSSAPLQNKNTGGAEYPRHKDDVYKGDTDLHKVTLMNLRGKGGPSGMPFELVVSQGEGLLVGLSEFNYIKTHGRFGLGGNDRNYYLELVPDVALSRTTVRGKINEEPRLQRALEITSELCQMQNMWHDMEEGLFCDPKTLYDDLKEKGYDWEILLNTRGFWIFEEQEHPLPFLSTMDLLKMRQGEYHPAWYDQK